MKSSKLSSRGDLVILALALLVGCAGEPPALRNPPAGSPPSVTLRVLVVNEPELAEAIDRLRGEWSERFGGTLSATSEPWAEVVSADAITADLIVFPTRYLGELATRGWLRPVRQNVLESDVFDAADVFPLVRRELVTWGGQVMALPLGVDLPKNGLLVVAAPDAVSNNRIGVLFDPETMKPRIAEPPFVDALTKLQDGMAAAGSVPVLGLGDRLVGVAAASRNAASAFKLLAWLASAEISSQLAAATGGTMPVRRSLASSRDWYDSGLSASERNDRGRALEQSLSGERCLVIPRIPGVDDFLAALDEAVNSAVSGEVAPQAALEQAAAKWEQITDAHGRDAQRAAYLKHLGITER